MKKYFILLFLLVLSLRPTMSQECIFPTPDTLVLDKGYFSISPQQTIQGHGEYARQLASRLQQQISDLNLHEGKSKGKIQIGLHHEKESPAESYTIKVTAQGVTLEAADEAGLYHGYEALLQMIRFNQGKIQYCALQSHPRYGWRGFMLDESRHFMGKEKVKQYLDLMAMLHLNVFHWHLTDAPGWRIEIKRYPKLTTEGAVGNWHDPMAPAKFYTQEEIREIVTYAAERHIMIVPEFDMPGHATAICRAYPEVSGGGEGKWKHFTFHPCKEETFEMIGHIFDELFELFPAPYIHVGGDEVHFGNQSWKTDAQIQEFIKKNDLKDEVGLERYFIRRIADLVAQRGRTIIAWDEAVEAGVDPQKMMVMWWHHEKPKKLTKALDLGYRVILCPRRPLYADFLQHESHKYGRRWRDGICPLEDVYHFPNSILPLLENHEQQILGLQMNLWTERIPDTHRADFMTFPRLAAAAEAAWDDSKVKDYDIFMKKLPLFLKHLDHLGVYYFNPFHPEKTPEPGFPEKLNEMKIGDE